MDILTSLSPRSQYSTAKLQLILAGWVMGTLFERAPKVSTTSGHVAESDYSKQSIYSFLYSLYRSVGVVRAETGEPYEVTFNTWGYAWPAGWGRDPHAGDPQRYGRNAYSGLFEFAAVKEYIKARDGRVHVVEMGCGTGAGASHVCASVLPKCTYEAVDMQEAGIQTCKRKFVPKHQGRLVGTRADCTDLPIRDNAADIVAVCETHVTECGGVVTDEDARFFRSAYRVLKPGGYLVWGNAIPDSTWQPTFDFLTSLGMKVLEVRDVTKEAITARDEDADRVGSYVDQCIERFFAFKIPVLGRKKRVEAELAMKNFYRNPGTNLYADMTTGADSYKVVLAHKPAAS